MKIKPNPAARPKTAKPKLGAAKASRPATPVKARRPAPRVVPAPAKRREAVAAKKPVIPAKTAPAATPMKAPVSASKPAPIPMKSGTPPTRPNGNGHAIPMLPRPVSQPIAAKIVIPPRPPAKSTARPEPLIPPDKDLSSKHKSGPMKDRIVLMVPDPFWLHCYWELSLQSVQRAEAALGQDWHQAKPIIRLVDVSSSDTTSTAEGFVRDIVVHGGCHHWYIDVPQPPRTYRADIGYVSKRGQFYVLARSNTVTPPIAGSSESMENNWAEGMDSASADRILAMSTGYAKPDGPSQLKEFFDEQFKKPYKEGSFGGGAMPGKLKKFAFELDAELVVSGRSDPNATVTLQNEPVKLRPDGTFTMRFILPDSRQIIPAVATSADGLEEQTIVLAVERNIKRLDPNVHDGYGD